MSLKERPGADSLWKGNASATHEALLFAGAGNTSESKLACMPGTGGIFRTAYEGEII
jgi:hypothetical protein